jgi:phosphate transport system protein
MNQPTKEPHAHLFSRLDSDLQKLKQQVATMGQEVDAQVMRAIDAFVRRDSAQAELVVAGDKRVNDLEREIDERCVLALALLQPEASDLRFVAAVLKIVTDLERIGDFAVSIAKSVYSLAPAKLASERELLPLSQAALSVLRRALDAFIRRDTAEAQQTATADLPVTLALLELGRALRDEIRREPQVLETALAALFVTKYLERIAEHSTNVAEMALYTERGEDIRHLVEHKS